MFFNLFQVAAGAREPCGLSSWGYAEASEPVIWHPEMTWEAGF